MVVDYLKKTVGRHNSYAYQFIFCEFLNLVNIICQMYFMDQFFNGHFRTYGSELLTVSNMEADKRVDPMAKIFPKLSKCTFHRYGPSGTIVNHDGINLAAGEGATHSLDLCFRFVHSPSQHHQREDLCLPLVLVHDPHRVDLHLLLLQNRHHRLKVGRCPAHFIEQC